MLRSPALGQGPKAVPNKGFQRHARHTRCLAAAPASAAPSTHGAAQAAEAPSGKCPFAGGNLFTRLTHTSPPRGEAPEQEQLSTTPRDYLPFQDQPWQGLTTGLSPIDPEHLFEIDEHYDEEIEEKRQLMRSRRDQVFRVNPEGEECCQELLEAMSAFLAQRFPDRFQLREGRIHNSATGEAFDLHGSGMHPLEAAGFLVQEDLCLMKEDARGALRLVAGAVAFPMRWSLLQKMGRRLHLVHGPVPFYNRDIRKPVDEFMAALTPAQAFERANWGVTDYPFLFQAFTEDEIIAAVKGLHSGSTPEPITVSNAADRLYLRCERQTLSRLERTNAVLFTIRTYTRPLSELADRPAVCKRLAGALRNTDDAFANYKTMTSFKAVALDWLDQHSS